MDELNNWNTFRKNIGILYDQGVEDGEIARMYSGKAVQWEGVVKTSELDQQYAKSLTMRMGSDLLPIRGGKVLRANHVSLPVKGDKIEQWSGCVVGDHLKFKAFIDSGGGPFDVIELVSTDEDPEVMLVVRLGMCELVDNCGQRKGGE